MMNKEQIVQECDATEFEQCVAARYKKRKPVFKQPPAGLSAAGGELT
jgi:hypothetical protein